VLYSTPNLRVDVKKFRSDAQWLPNPIEVERFTPRSPNDEAHRDVLVGVRLAPSKGPEQITAFVRTLRRIRPATTVTVIDQGGPIGAVLAAAGSTAQLRPKHSRAALPGLMREHRIAVGQFGLGAMGNYELEAQACGLPLVVGELLPEAPEYEAPAPVLSSNRMEQLAATAADLLDEPARLTDVGALAAAWVRKYHAADAIAGEVEALYESLLGART